MRYKICLFFVFIFLFFSSQLTFAQTLQNEVLNQQTQQINTTEHKNDNSMLEGKINFIQNDLINIKDTNSSLIKEQRELKDHVASIEKETLELKKQSVINSGDTAWMLTSSALVLLMTIPGLALFYAGMSRKKNLISTSTQVFSCAIIVTALWVICGYSLVFSDGFGVIGGLDKTFLHGVVYVKDGATSVHSLAPTIPEFVFAMFQLTFAIITPALIVGAFVERIKYSTMLVFIAAWSLLVYAPIAHWVWSPNGWISKLGALDFAGGLVVHTSSGIAGLIFSILSGKRHGYGVEPMPPANLVYTMIGASLLWFGWFGFNAGSAGAADGRAGIAMMNTQIGAVFACIGWMALEWFYRKRPSLLGICSGVVAGLVAITPAAGFVTPASSIIIGLAAGIICYFACTRLKKKFQYDDSLDVFGIHGVGGILGSILTGVFVSQEIGGVSTDILKQLISTLAVVAYSGIMTTIIIFSLKLFMNFRVEEVQEEKGLDIAMHGERVD